MNITPAYKLAVVAILFSYCKHNLRNDKKKKTENINTSNRKYLHHSS